MKNNYFTKKILPIFVISVLGILVSCTNDAKELDGDWSNTFSLTDDYTRYRVFSTGDRRYTFFQTLSFVKLNDENGGLFEDVITPMVFQSDPYEVVVGSKVGGTWEINKGMLFLYYDGDVELTHADNLSFNDKMQLEEQMEALFFKDFDKLGLRGLKYEIKNDHLKIYFGNFSEDFTKNNSTSTYSKVNKKTGI